MQRRLECVPTQAGALYARRKVAHAGERRKFYFDDGQVEIARALRHSVHGPEPVLVHSEYGHDAFLIEHAVVGDALRRLLDA